MRNLRTAARKQRRSVLLAIALWAIALSLTAVLLAPGGQGARAAAPHASPVKLFMIPKFTGIPPFTQADQGAAQYARTFGYRLDYGGPTSSSASEQVKFIDTAVARGYKGIFISAGQPAARTAPPE